MRTSGLRTTRSAITGNNEIGACKFDTADIDIEIPDVPGNRVVGEKKAVQAVWGDPSRLDNVGHYLMALGYLRFLRRRYCTCCASRHCLTCSVFGSLNAFRGVGSVVSLLVATCFGACSFRATCSDL